MTADIISEAAARAARVAAGGAFLDAREPGWLHRIDLAKLDLYAPCKCVLGQLATDKHGDLDGWTWTGICGVFGVTTWHDSRESLDCNLGFNVPPPASRAEYTALTAEWIRYIEQRRAAA